MDLETLHDLYMHELNDLYDAENQIIEALPKMIDAASERMARNVLVMDEAIQQSTQPRAGLPN